MGAFSLQFSQKIKISIPGPCLSGFPGGSFLHGGSGDRRKWKNLASRPLCGRGGRLGGPWRQSTRRQRIDRSGSVGSHRRAVGSGICPWQRARFRAVSFFLRGPHENMGTEGPILSQKEERDLRSSEKPASRGEGSGLEICRP